MAGSFACVSYIGGLLGALGLGYRFGLARGRRRERRAQILQHRLTDAVASAAAPEADKAGPAPGAQPRQASQRAWHLERHG